MGLSVRIRRLQRELGPSILKLSLQPAAATGELHDGLFELGDMANESLSIRTNRRINQWIY